MDENNKKNDKAASRERGSISEWFNGIVGEFKRISWPNRTELVKMIVTVIITGGIFGGIIVAYDTLLGLGYDGLVRLFGN